MDEYYIDLSVQNSSELLKNNNSVNLIHNINNNNSNLNNNNEDLIEGFGNFGRVNLEKCCPLEYMWSEGQKKCVKVCDGCAIGAYGDINYEFLTSNGEFMSFAQCVGDATEAYDFDKINRRYGIDELVTQHDLNFHIDSDENASGVQPAEENPWANLNISKAASGSVRNIGRYAADAQEAYLESIGQESEYLDNRVLLCSTSNENILITAISPTTSTTQEGSSEPQVTDPPSEDQSSYTLCDSKTPNSQDWERLCNLEDDDYNSLNFESICNNVDNNAIIDRLCNNNNLIKNLICPDNR
tara:strand:+ start:3463 stop:4359 length:897 start_codon:yes stop_codon:yes gene_type:complete